MIDYVFLFREVSYTPEVSRAMRDSTLGGQIGSHSEIRAIFCNFTDSSIDLDL